VAALTTSATDQKPSLIMPAGQAVELLVGGRRNSTYALPARYVGNFAPGRDAPPRRLSAQEREAAGRAGQLLSDALMGVPVDELEAQNAVELLHRLAGDAEGEPRFQLEDGRLVASRDVSYRARLD
jgi:hypothetical protein